MSRQEERIIELLEEIRDELVSADSTDTETDTNTDTHYCGHNGCERTVDTPDETCWQHSE